MARRIGSFLFDTERFSLTRNGETIPLEPKPMRLLLHLVRRHPASVSKQELLQGLWPDAQVTEASLTRSVHAARQALGPEGRQIIQTVRGHGYRLGVPIDADDSCIAPLRPTLAQRPADPFVGRRSELSALRGLLADAASGRGRVGLLSGEPGIGKTRTAEVLARDAADRGFEVVLGHVREGAPALWPWLLALRSLVRAREPERLLAELGSGAADLAEMVPEVLQSLPKLDQAPRLPSSEARFRFFDAAAQFLAHASLARPILFVLEDLHFADATTLRLLAFAAAEWNSARVTVLCTYRHVAAPANVPLDHALAELHRLPGTAPEIRLKGLDAEEAAALVGALRGETLDVEEGYALAARSSGNPFFLRELARARETGGGGIRTFLRHRLAALKESTRETLEVASVLGREFPIGQLAAASSETSSRVWDAIEEAEHAGFIEAAVEADAYTFRFIHALIQEFLYESLSRRYRAELHRACGEAIERMYPYEWEARSADLARHFEAGVAAGGSVDRALDHAERAAAQSMKRLAFEVSLTQLENGLQLLQDAGKMESERACALLVRKALVLDRMGQTAAADNVRWAALRGALERNYIDVAISAAQGMVGRRCEVKELSRALDAILDRLGNERSPRRAVTLAQRSLTGYWVSSCRELAALSESGLELARETGDREALREALTSRMWFTWCSSDFELRRQIANERIQVATDSGDEVLGRSARVALELEAAAPERFEVELRRCEELVGKRRFQADLHAEVLDARATQALWHGDFSRAEILTRRSRRAFALRNPEEAASRAGLKLFAIRRLQGRSGELREIIRDASEQTRDEPGQRILFTHRALLNLDAGRVREAHDIFENLAARGFEDVRRDTTYLSQLANLSELACGVADTARAELLHELLLPWATRYVCTVAAVAQGAVDRFLGLLAHACGRLDEAESRFESALATEERMGALPFEGLARFDYARLLLDRDGSGVRARAELERARALAQLIGMSRLLSDARQLHARLAPASASAG